MRAMHEDATLSYGFHTARHLPELKTPAVST